MKQEQRRSTCERINQEPTILKGLSSSELKIAIFFTLLFWVPFSLLVGFLSGYPTMGFGLIGIGSILTVLAIGSIFQRLKRGRPHGYYQQVTTLFFVRLGLKQSPFVKYSGTWSVGRTTHSE